MNKTTPEKSKKSDLKTGLARLTEIARWFDGREDADVEDGLEKVKEAAGLIAETKKRLKNIENEFEEIKKDFET